MPSTRSATAYYGDKLELLRDLFGADRISLEPERIVIDGHAWPVVDDVIVLLPPEKYPAALRHRLGQAAAPAVSGDTFAEDIQATFGAEWQTFDEILPEHEREFRQYFDIVDIPALRGQRVCDLGCGIGRWSHFLKDVARELILVDFSEAIFVARENLRDAPHAVFIMADLQDLPFRDDCADFAFCLGVAHHLPVEALTAVRRLGRLAPRFLVYLYSALDGHPVHYRLLHAPVGLLRRLVCRVSNPAFRSVFTWLCVLFLYLPMIAVGTLLRPFGLSRYVPLYDFYAGKSLHRIRQDAYDRFFTSIEQRFSRADIMTLTDSFAEVTISPQIPMWHFLCRR